MGITERPEPGVRDTQIVPALQRSQYSWLRPLGPDVYGSIDIHTPQGRLDYYHSQMGECLDLDGLSNLHIAVRDVILHPASKEDKATGEVSYFTRIIMFT